MSPLSFHAPRNTYNRYWMNDLRDGPPRLNSWKEIAAHLGVSVRTAQRWERTGSLPVRRHRHAAADSVFAYRQDLDAWWDSRPHLRQQPPEDVPMVASIAVLPFANLNRDVETEIFSDGLTEELINALAQVAGMRVVARTSAFHFKGKTGDARAIGARLGVGTILEGSVRRSQDRLRIIAQLISAADGCHLWSQRYDRRMQDVFQLQEEIARGIVEALRVSFSGNRITRPYGSDPEAYTLYLEGRHQWNKRTRPGILKAVECFKSAVARDAGMAPAWAGLADCYAMLPPYGEMPAAEALRQARGAARKALEIDDKLAEAHVALAFATAVYEFDWAGAETRFRRALDLNSNYAYAHLLYAAVVLAPTMRLDEALTHQRRACELDPLSAVTMSAMGAALMMVRQFDEVISTCRQALELDPAYPWAYRWLGEACLLKGVLDKAEDALSRIEAPMVATGFLSYCYARTDRAPQARHLLRQLEEKSSRNPMLALQVAVGHLGLGDRDLALDWLHRALDARAVGIYWLNIEPIWDVLRSDPRFTALLTRLRLAD